MFVNYFHQSKSSPDVLMKEKKSLHVIEALLATLSLQLSQFLLPSLTTNAHYIPQ